MNYTPLISSDGLFHIAIALKVHIDGERKNVDYATAHYETFDTLHCSVDDFYLAQAWREDAEQHKYALRILDDLFAAFWDNISPEAQNEITESFAYIDKAEHDRKAG